MASQLSAELPAPVISDKAYSSDALDQKLALQGVEMIVPNRANRRVLQDGRLLRRYKGAGLSSTPLPGRKTAVVFASVGENPTHFPRFSSLRLRSSPHETNFGIGTNESKDFDVFFWEGKQRVAENSTNIVRELRQREIAVCFALVECAFFLKSASWLLD